MRSREPGTPCKMYVDGIPQLQAGDFITTPAGSAYLVQTIRPSPSIAHRRYLGCVRWPIDEIPDEARRFEIRWYRRAKRRAR